MSKCRLRTRFDEIEREIMEGKHTAESVFTDMRTAALYMQPTARLQKYDDVLIPFLGMMRAELHANAGKGDRPGWLQMDVKTALLEIFYHMGKLQKAAKNGDVNGIREYSADVANMSMMLADICGVLPKPAPAVPQPEQSGLVEALERVKLTSEEAKNHSASGVAYWNNAVTTCILALSAQGEGHE